MGGAHKYKCWAKEFTKETQNMIAFIQSQKQNLIMLFGNADVDGKIIYKEKHGQDYSTIKMVITSGGAKGRGDQE